MIIYRFVLIVAIMVMATDGLAEIRRDPIGVNVSVDKPMSLTVRFADSEGTRFTTTEALFCYRLLDNGQCDPAALLGRLPASRDLGSTSVPVSRITDVMTIPYSIIRSTVVRAQEVDFSDFYYVRRFTPEGSADLGAGPGRDVYVRVTCHLAGPATVPLSLTKVSVYGIEQGDNAPVRLLRLHRDNLETGYVEARVEHTGTGILEGWWEVRQPGDAEVSSIDLLPAAALSSSERSQQQAFMRIKRFRVTASREGVAIIPGPRYQDLPMGTGGRHDLLLRFDATQGRENRARLAVEGEPLNLFSGAVAGFSIPTLEYTFPVDLLSADVSVPLAARLISDIDDDGNKLWRLAWNAQAGEAVAIEFVVRTGTQLHSLLAPVDSGMYELTSQWSERLPGTEMTVQLRGGDGVVLGEAVRVRTE